MRCDAGWLGADKSGRCSSAVRACSVVCMENDTIITVGCWVDSTHGIYGFRRVCEVAKSFGYYGLDEAWHLDADDTQAWLVEAEEAETWLNKYVAEAGYSFGWHDGEFFYQSDAWWSDNA